MTLHQDPRPDPAQSHLRQPFSGAVDAVHTPVSIGNIHPNPFLVTGSGGTSDGDGAAADTVITSVPWDTSSQKPAVDSSQHRSSSQAGLASVRARFGGSQGTGGRG